MLDADATDLEVLGAARGCSSGHPATGRLRRELRTSAHAVAVTVIERAPHGDQTRVEAPPTPHTIVLDEPLDDRELVGDG